MRKFESASLSGNRSKSPVTSIIFDFRTRIYILFEQDKAREKGPKDGRLVQNSAKDVFLAGLVGLYTLFFSFGIVGDDVMSVMNG